MRILQVNSAGQWGGGETHVVQLVDALRKRGHTVALAGRSKGPLNPDYALPFLNSADFVSAFRLRRVIQRGRFEIVHAHVARDYPVVAAAAWRLAGVKVVLTRHMLYPVRKHFLYGRIDGWIAPTAQILKILEPLKPKQAAVITSWVDLEKFPYRPHAFHQPVTVGLIGQIAPHKGHDQAIEAIRQLGSGFRLLVAGKGDPSYEARLRAQSAGLPVEFLGPVSLPGFFGEVDILVLPSLKEAFGIILLEAMASGIPVIATNRDGPAEIVRSGLLIPPHDPRALADAIRSVRPGDFIREARNHMERDFDLRAVVPRIEEFYRALSSGNRN